MDEKGQGAIGGILGALIATFMLYIYFVIVSPINDLLLPQMGNAANGATLIVVWGLIPLVLVFGIIMSIWIAMTSGRQQYPPQY